MQWWRPKHPTNHSIDDNSCGNFNYFQKFIHLYSLIFPFKATFSKRLWLLKINSLWTQYIEQNERVCICLFFDSFGMWFIYRVSYIRNSTRLSILSYLERERRERNRAVKMAYLIIIMKKWRRLRWIKWVFTFNDYILGYLFQPHFNFYICKRIFSQFGSLPKTFTSFISCLSNVPFVTYFAQ